MRVFKIVAMFCTALVLAACSDPKPVLRTDLPKATGLVLYKAERRMLLLQGNTVLKEYDFKLGFAPIGHKQFEGDGKTPEGQYFIDRKNPNSQFHLSVGISYPNSADRRAAGRRSPGGDIFIHGTPRPYRFFFKDWTWGCVAVSNREIEEIYAMVDIGTPIWIYP